MTLKPILLTFLSCIMFSVNVYSAEFSVTDTKKNYILLIKGKINSGDFDQFIAVVKATKSFPFIVMVDSPGGDVLEAIKIARFIRRAMLVVFAPYECNSACSYLVFASRAYPKGGVIGLHRPYFNKRYFAGLSSDQATKKYKELSHFVRNYLIEVSVPTALIDQMMATSSENVIYISMEKYTQTYGDAPPAIDEWLRAKCGSLSTDEKIDWELYASKLAGLDSSKQIQKFDAMSDGYLKYLENKATKLGICQKKGIETEQQKILSEYLKK